MGLDLRGVLPLIRLCITCIITTYYQYSHYGDFTRTMGWEQANTHYEDSNRWEEPQRSSSDESEESEPEPPPPSVIRRKVSFADAFGLELVSVKEFDSTAETGPNGLERLLGVEAREENYYLSSLFTVPSSDEELSLLLQQNKLELESIELMPGSTTIRGIIQVLNLSYQKAVYVRTTLDRWQTHFDLLAEYIPGSSDGQTDRFSFRLTLVPPFQTDGARVEFCLRYESSAGTFWANNGGTNYVLFCHQKGGRELKEKEGEKERDTEENYPEKKSCLKGRRKWSNAELKSTGSSSDLSEPESSKSEKSEEEKTQNEAVVKACHKTLAERRNRRRAARLARVQDYLSQRQTEVQKMERDLNMAIPASQLSTPVELDTSEVSLVHRRKDQDTPPILTYHQIPLLSLDWGKNTTPLTHTNTPKIYSGASPDMPEKQLTEEESSGSSTNAWEAFLKGTGSSDTHANALDQECLLCMTSFPSHNECNMSTPWEKVLSESLQSPLTSGNRSLRCFSPEETLESDPAEKWQDFKPCHAKEKALGNKHTEKPGITTETHIVQESELVWVQPGTKTQDGLTYREKSFSEDASFPESKNSVQIVDATESQDSKGEHRVSPEECVGNPNYSAPEDDVKGDSDKMVSTTLTFREIKDEPFTDRQTGTGGSLERLCRDENRELKWVKEHIRKENEIAVEIKVKISCNEYPGDLTEGLESRCQEESEEPSQLRNQSMEMISASKSMVFDEEEFNRVIEWTDTEASKSQKEEEIGWHKPEKERLAEKSETMSSVAVDKYIADREHEISSIAKMEGQEEQYEVDETVQGRKGGGDACKDLITCKDPHKTHSTTDTCTNASTHSVTSHSSDPSGLFGCTESVSEGGPLLFSGSFGETLRYRAAQGLQDLQDPEAESPAPLSKTATPSGSTVSGRLLEWWVEFCSLRHISKALLYTILFLIFITAYLHDLPVCLGIYLLSACWWCGQSMKKRVAAADGVD
ncbi:uncharacterized protein ppp1r3aa isoform X1 [Pygocentrus nattereri]|uniref:uncharacterized protein ppp1r3aa isoform X1 n=1 Tax=Pygocentrus nattereri TaxID=42514 RepID=UPI001890FE27|nr:uncharacterized protein ppp1r3aa isoform X1 [Pygocentrus nattereri]